MKNAVRRGVRTHDPISGVFPDFPGNPVFRGAEAGLYVPLVGGRVVIVRVNRKLSDQEE